MQIKIENSFNFQRFLLEAGLSIGGALATGGAALPTISKNKAECYQNHF